MTGFTTRKITKKQKTLGVILKTARKKMDLSLEEVEDKTRIRLKYLRALEEGNYHDLPAEAYNIGFVRQYSEFLGIKKDNVLSLYKEERLTSRIPKQKKLFTPIKTVDWHFLITPKFIGVVFGVLLLGGIASYIGYQLKRFTDPPEINLTNIPDEYMTNKDTVKVAGTTSVGSMVFINGELIGSSQNGEFSQDVKLNPGVNEIALIAKNRAEKESKKLVKVLYSQDSVALSGSTN